MKLKTIYFLLLSFVFSVFTFAQNTNPVVSNVAFSISGTTVTVTYDVTDAEEATVSIQMEVSNDGGLVYDYDYGTATGDIGTGITTGSKTITWQYAGNNTDVFKIKIIANDETADGSPCQGIATIMYSGQTYNTIQIGDQCWLKENLNVGTMIIGDNNQTSGNGIEKYCYENVEANCTQYGGLYQWNEAMQYVTTEGTQGICPSGWHIPSYVELQTLNTTISNSGNALKSVGEGTGNGAGTNSSGFSALLAGTRFANGTFSNINYVTYFWISSETGSTAYYMSLNYNNNSVNYYNTNNNGFSVRCLKD